MTSLSPIFPDNVKGHKLKRATPDVSKINNLKEGNSKRHDRYENTRCMQTKLSLEDVGCITIFITLRRHLSILSYKTISITIKPKR